MAKLKKQTGSVTVEFAIGSFFLFLFFFVLSELCYMMFISSSMDIILSTSVRIIRNELPLTLGRLDYKDVFGKYINESNDIWSYFIDKNKLKFEVEYYKDLSSLESGITTSEHNYSSIAKYKLTYDYNSIFPGLMDKAMLARESFYLQEYERDKFDY